jgi:hypothetical protein
LKVHKVHFNLLRIRFTRPLSLLVSARTEVSETADMSRHRRERMSGEYLHCNVCLRDVPRGVWTIFLSAWASLLMFSILFFTVTPAGDLRRDRCRLFGPMAFGLPMVMADAALGWPAAETLAEARPSRLR